MDPSEKRLAIAVEDHLLEYRLFEGIIPAKVYGAGPVVIWDEGIFKPLEDPMIGLEKGHLSFRLDGKKLKGDFALTLMKGRGSGKEWLLIKRRDDFANPKLNNPPSKLGGFDPIGTLIFYIRAPSFLPQAGTPQQAEENAARYAGSSSPEP
jgi:hypothetical protein